jgi:hypothetical protein
MLTVKNTHTLPREWLLQRKPKKQLRRKKPRESKMGLYSNINAKKKRIAAGSGETMRKPGSKGSPTAKDFKQAKKTAKTK